MRWPLKSVSGWSRLSAWARTSSILWRVMIRLTVLLAIVAYPLQAALFDDLHHGQRTAIRAVVQRLGTAVRRATLVGRYLHAPPAPITARHVFGATVLFFQLAEH